jgi:hypothetical protein
MHRIDGFKEKCVIGLACTVLLILADIPLQAVLAQSSEERVRVEVYLEQPQVEIGKQTALLFRISNNSGATLGHIELGIRNEQVELEVTSVPTTVPSATSVLVIGTVKPLTPGSFALFPVLSYTTTVSSNAVRSVLPEDLPTLQAVLPPTPWHSFLDFPREIGSVLVGVAVTLVSVGLTSYVNYWIGRRRERWETLEMLQAAVRAIIEVLDARPARPVPVDALEKASSSPHFERLLALIRRRKRRRLLGQLLARVRRSEYHQPDITRIPQTLVKLQAEAHYYGQRYAEGRGDVSPIIGDNVKKKAEELVSLLREL